MKFVLIRVLYNHMEKKVINTSNAPAPIGPYNQAIMVNDQLYISGQVCIDPASGNLKNKDLQEETGLSSSQVKVYLHRARIQLKEYIVKIENVI